MQIPTKSRELVLARQMGRCFRCGCALARVGGQWAHRRTRAVVDEHTMCPCNGLYLCATCHLWEGKHPRVARRLGFVVSRYEPDPSTIPIQTPLGVVLLDHVGGQQITGSEN